MDNVCDTSELTSWGTEARPAETSELAERWLVINTTVSCCVPKADALVSEDTVS
jgi:hypothetical protein